MTQQTKNNDIHGILYKAVEHIFSWFCKDSELNGSKTFPNVMCFTFYINMILIVTNPKYLNLPVSEHTLPQSEIILISIEIQ
jgi:hypothetical protein